MQATMKIGVLGATGRLGTHVAEVLREQGHEVVPMSRSLGVDVVTGEGLAQALAGVDCVIDVASWHSPDQQEATAFFVNATRNLRLSSPAGVADPGTAAPDGLKNNPTATPATRPSGRPSNISTVSHGDV